MNLKLQTNFYTTPPLALLIFQLDQFILRSTYLLLIFYISDVFIMLIVCTPPLKCKLHERQVFTLFTEIFQVPKIVWHIVLNKYLVSEWSMGPLFIASRTILNSTIALFHYTPSSEYSFFHLNSCFISLLIIHFLFPEFVFLSFAASQSTHWITSLS